MSAASKGRKPLRISVRRGAGGAVRGAKRKRRPLSAAPAKKKGGGSVPALFCSPPTGRSGCSSVEDGLDDEEEEEDEFGSLSDLAVAADGYCHGGADPSGAVSSDVLLALRSLVRRGAAALCPPPPFSVTAAAPIPFVLRPMLRHALLSTVSAAAVESASDFTFGSEAEAAATAAARADEANRAASAEASTGLNIELGRLRKSNVVRVLRLSGTSSDAVGDESVMEATEYVRGCRDVVEADVASHAARTGGGKGGGVYGNGVGSAGDLSADERRAIGSFFVAGLAVWTRSYVTEEEMAERLLQQRSAPTSGGRKEGGYLDAMQLPLPRVGARSVADYLASISLLLPRRDISGHSNFTGNDHGGRAYWFTLPGMGTAARYISKGRSRVLAKLRSARYKEMKRSVLEMGMVEVDSERRRRLGEGSSDDGSNGSDAVAVVRGVPAAFVVRDLLSRGVVTVREMPAGQFIKLV